MEILKIKEKIERFILLIIMSLIMICFMGIKSQAEEVTIDATQTIPYSYTLGASQNIFKAPISFSKVGVYTYKVEVSNFANDVHVNILDGELHGEFMGFSGAEHEFTKVVTEPLYKDLYVFSENAPAVEKTIKITFNYYEPETVGRVVQEGENVRAITTDTLYYSMNLSKDSIVTISGDGVTLLDKNKNSLNLLADSKNNVVVNLKRGDYYLKVGRGITEFKYTTKSLKLANNITKKKAKKIKLGNTIKMITYATNDKKAPLWYKFTLKKTKRISVTADASKLLGGGFDIYIFKTKSNKVPYLEGTINENKKMKIELSGQIKKGKNNYIESNKIVKLPAGTYYIVVNNTCSGSSTVKVK